MWNEQDQKACCELLECRFHSKSEQLKGFEGTYSGLGEVGT